MGYGPYRAVANGATVDAAAALVELLTPSDAVVWICQIIVTQRTLETNEQSYLQVTLESGAGTGGSSFTPLETGGAGQAASACTVNVSSSTERTIGTPTTSLWLEGFNLLAGYERGWGDPSRPGPGQGLFIPPSTRVGICLPTAPSAANTVDAIVDYFELGWT